MSCWFFFKIMLKNTEEMPHQNVLCANCRCLVVQSACAITQNEKSEMQSTQKWKKATFATFFSVKCKNDANNQNYNLDYAKKRQIVQLSYFLPGVKSNMDPAIQKKHKLYVNSNLGALPDVHFLLEKTIHFLWKEFSFCNITCYDTWRIIWTISCLFRQKKA